MIGFMIGQERIGGRLVAGFVAGFVAWMAPWVVAVPILLEGAAGAREPAVAEPPTSAGSARAPAGDAAAAKPAPAKPAPEKPAATTGVAVIALEGSLAEGVGQGGILADVSPRLHRLVERLDRAAMDRKVGAVLVAMKAPELGRARADEIRAAILRLRAKGKPVAVHLLDAEPVHYLVAGAADEILIAPAATLAITGVRAEVTFLKELLDKLGVEAEILQVGEFKGAGEMLTRSGMSPQLREQYESYVGDLFDQLVEQVAADRRLPRERVQELIDTGVFSPEAAQAAGLVDAIAYEDEAILRLARRAKLVPEGGGRETPPKVLRDYARQSLDEADFSGITGLMKLMDLFSGGGKAGSRGGSKRIAVVHLTGAIEDGSSPGLLAGGGGPGPVIKALRAAAADDSVAAIVLRIDSPGGSALASDLIWREASRASKPVVASLSDTAASGGYYVAVAADRIVAAPGTLTGSIGVVGGKVAVGSALARLGVHTDVVSRGRNAGWLSMQEPFRDHEREAFLGTMRGIYHLFTTKVAEGRKIDPARMPELAEGRIYTGRQALDKGLVDRLGTLDDAIAEAKRLAGIGEEESVDRVLLPEPRGLFEDLFGAAGETGDPLVGPAAAGLLARGLPPGRIEGGLLEALSPVADSLLLIASGRPLMLLPVRVMVR
jgi:protease-4